MSAVSLSDGPERFKEVREVCLFGPEGKPLSERSFEIESVRAHRSRLVFKFRGIDTISAAERLEGAEVRILATERRELPPDEYYQSDLVGSEVVERATGERLGVVKAFREFGGPPLLEVEGQGEPLLIPFARSICVTIDRDARRILVDLPEGLKELSR